jgi:hypothetical protein
MFRLLLYQNKVYIALTAEHETPQPLGVAICQDINSLCGYCYMEE